MKLGEQRLRCAYVTSGIGRNTRDTGVAVRQGGFRSSGRASRLGGGSWQQEGGTELVLPLGEAAQPPSAPQTLFLPSQPKCSAKPERLSSHAQAARTTECECTFHASAPPAPRMATLQEQPTAKQLRGKTRTFDGPVSSVDLSIYS